MSDSGRLTRMVVEDLGDAVEYVGVALLGGQPVDRLARSAGPPAGPVVTARGAGLNG